MRLEAVDTLLQNLGWQPPPGVKFTLLEKKSILRERLELLPTVDDAGLDAQRARVTKYGLLAKKNKEKLNEICKELEIPFTGNETKPQLTRKIKEKQLLPPEVLADNERADFGKYRGRTYEWIYSNDPSYCHWVTDTFVEEGPDKCSTALRRLAE